MVVTRRPSVPLPVAPSRTPSTGGAPTSSEKAKKKAPQRAVSSPLVSDVTSGDTGSSKEAGKSHSRNARKHAKRSKDRPQKARSRTATLWNWLFGLLLSAFAYHVITTCPTDYLLDAPACKIVNLYKERVIAPYVYRPALAALRHPSVSPHIIRMEPYIYQTLDTAMPYYHGARRQWSGTVVPTYMTYVHPQVESVRQRLQPHILIARKQLDSALGPYVIVIQDKATVAYSTALPYYNQGILTARDSWNAVEPYATPAYQKTQELPYIFYEQVYVPTMEARRQYADPHVIQAYVQLASLLGKYRRVYVDQHIFRIWEQLQEMAGSKPRSARSAHDDFRNSPPSTSKAIAGSFAENVSTVAAMAEQPTPRATTTEAEKVVVAITSEHTTTPSLTEAITALSVAEPTTTSRDEHVSIDSRATNPPLVETASDLPLTFEEEPHASHPMMTTDSTPATVETGEDASADLLESSSDDDYDNFMEEMRRALQDAENEDLVDGEKEDHTPVQPVPVDDRPPNEERRADVERRHNTWEAKLRALTKKVQAGFVSDLTSIRKENADFLSGSDGDPFGIKQLQLEAEKALRNAENYSQKLKADLKIVDPKQKDDLWEQVVNRVDGKFTDRVDRIEEQVRTWWQGVYDREMLLVHNAFVKLENLGDSAQTDIGMDYSWLDDVTYMDWQRYHKLKHGPIEQKTIMLSMQDGTHADAPGNTALHQLAEMQTELQEIVDGFEVRLRQIFDNGFHGMDSNPSDEPDDPEVSILPIADDPEPKLATAQIGILSRSEDEVKAAMGRAGEAIDDETSHPEEHDEFSILPIPPQETIAPEILDAHLGILSRGSDEIKEAMDRSGETSSESAVAQETDTPNPPQERSSTNSNDKSIPKGDGILSEGGQEEEEFSAALHDDAAHREVIHEGSGKARHQEL